TDDDNYWNNVNPQQDEAATDAHWGAEMTFDYFAQVHNYTGIDGENMPLISYVHYSENWVNAQWTGNWARFGDGNGTSYSSMAALDIVAHEFGHGITQFNAGLIYQDESGALNESFSDIFGAAVEFWASPELSDWYSGEDANINGNGLRDMANPKSKGDPDTYRGQNWINGGEDNGGVHTNSGVQNYWFHLLAEGGSGSNDN
ncbi:MAG: M4 family metallopeptidase, partial [Saprospiraceae bacterium]|nr:M4 family metallopeptidase [Saprospiraceae bacterium]